MIKDILLNVFHSFIGCVELHLGDYVVYCEYIDEVILLGDDPQAIQTTDMYFSSSKCKVLLQISLELVLAFSIAGERLEQIKFVLPSQLRHEEGEITTRIVYWVLASVRHSPSTTLMTEVCHKNYICQSTKSLALSSICLNVSVLCA